MQIQINTDNNVDSGPELTRLVEEEIGTALAPFVDRITRVDVHLGDEGAGKKGEGDMRCMLEARPAGHEPVTVTQHASTTGEAIRGASHKLHSLLESMFGRLDDRQPGGGTIRGPQ
ncbi:MAG: ribosomal subunit interface protein [Kineosporiaceae bacterium]|nr:ribosomal subunit interface protein [Aeromicrobium sp.]